jgi:hypothetical protein
MDNRTIQVKYLVLKGGTCKTRHEIGKLAALSATELRPGVPVGVLYREATIPWQLDFAGTSWVTEFKTSVLICFNHLAEFCKWLKGSARSFSPQLRPNRPLRELLAPPTSPALLTFLGVALVNYRKRSWLFVQPAADSRY